MEMALSFIEGMLTLTHLNFLLTVFNQSTRNLGPYNLTITLFEDFTTLILSISESFRGLKLTIFERKIAVEIKTNLVLVLTKIHQSTQLNCP